MSLDKAIKSGKEKRKPYRGEKSIDATCRNHGGCPWCEGNRKHKMRDKHPTEGGDEDAGYDDAFNKAHSVPQIERPARGGARMEGSEDDA